MTHKFIKIGKQFRSHSNQRETVANKSLTRQRTRKWKNSFFIFPRYQFNIVLAQKIINKISARQAELKKNLIKFAVIHRLECKLSLFVLAKSERVKGAKKRL